MGHFTFHLNFLKTNNFTLDINMNSTNIFNNTISSLPVIYNYQNQSDVTNLHVFNQTKTKVTKLTKNKIRGSNRTSPDKYNNIPRSKRRGIAGSQSYSVNHSSNRVALDGMNVIPKPPQGLQNNRTYPESLITAKDTMDRTLTQLKYPEWFDQETQKNNWQDLAKSLKTIKEYHYLHLRSDKGIDKIMKDSFENLFQLISSHFITTKSQFLVFESWVDIVSYDSYDSMSLRNNPAMVKTYLNRLHEVLRSSDKEIQENMFERSNVLFRYDFLEKCSYAQYGEWREKLSEIIRETLNLCTTFKERGYYYFIRNSMISYENLIKSALKSPIKNILQNDIVNIIEREFEFFFPQNSFTSEQKVITGKLCYLAIKSIKEENLTALSKFCPKASLKDVYSYQKEISVENMRVNITSSLPFDNQIIAKIPENLKKTHSYFIEAFQQIINTEGNIKFDLFVAKDKDLYETFNYLLLGTSTNNGGVVEYFNSPTMTVYIKSNEVWNLAHECNHVLFDFYIGFRDSYGKYGYLAWLNEGLSYVLIPNNFMKDQVKEVLLEKGLPNITNIIEATNQNYEISYSFTEYLLKKQKPILNELLVYKKRAQNSTEEKDQFIKKLEMLTFLEEDFHLYLKNRWEIQQSITKPTTPRTTRSHKVTTEPTIIDYMTRKNLKHIKREEQVRMERSAWTPSKGMDAVKKITYASIGPLTIGFLGVLYAIFGISKRKGGNGRPHSRLGDNKFAQNNLELKLLQVPGKGSRKN